MKIIGVFSLKSNIIISFQTPWNDPVIYKVNDILFCGTKEFMIDKIDRIYQGHPEKSHTTMTTEIQK